MTLFSIRWISVMASVAFLSACACPNAGQMGTASLLAGAGTDVSANPEGVDQDRNGIRDDVEAAIHSAYQNPQQQQLLKSYARALQSALLVDATDKEEALPAHDTLMTQTGCLYLAQKEGVFGHETSVRQKTDFVDSLTLNTELRKEKYKRFTLSTRFASRPDRPTREQCGF